MANSLTPVYQFILPEVTADNNLWGTHLNSDLTGEDALIARPNPQFFVNGTGAFNLNNGNYQELTVGGATVVSITNVPPALASALGSATVVFLKLINGGVNITWPGTVTWLTSNGQTPNLKAAGTDLIMLLTTNQGTSWLGVHLGINDAGPVVTPAVAPTTNIDLVAGTLFQFTLNQNTTVAILNASAQVKVFRLLVTNGGSQTNPITWPGSVVWLAGTPPSLQAAGVDALEFTTPDNGVTWYGARLDARTAERCKVAMNVNQSITSATDTAVVWDGAEFYDIGALHDPVVNPSRVKVPTAWTDTEAEVVAQIAWASMGANSSADVWVRKNGATELARVHVDTGPGGGAPTQIVIAFDNAPAANDYYEIMVRQASGINESVVAAKSWVRLARKR